MKRLNIYVAHSRAMDYVNCIYRPLRGSSLGSQHDIILPHEKSDLPFDSKRYLKESCSLLIADVSVQSTPVGVEIGWADMLGVPVICMYMQGTSPSGSLANASQRFIGYSSPDDMISKLELAISEMFREAG